MTKTHLNLIPPSIQRGQAVRRITSAWSAVVAMTGVVCLIACAVEWSRGMATVRRLEALDARFAPLSELIREQENLAGLVDDLRAREALTLQLSGETHGVTLLGAVAEAAERLSGSVYLLDLNFERTSQRRNDDAHKLRLSGAGVDSLAVSAFAGRLRGSGVFTEVTVESTRPIQESADEDRYFRFDIACVL